MLGIFWEVHTQWEKQCLDFVDLNGNNRTDKANHLILSSAVLFQTDSFKINKHIILTTKSLT
jgi:hypothetical protein